MHKTSVKQFFNKTKIMSFLREYGLRCAVALAFIIVSDFFIASNHYLIAFGLTGVFVFFVSLKEKRRTNSIATKVWALAAKLNLTVDDLSQLTTIGKYDLAAAKRNEYQPPEEVMKHLVQKLEYLAKQQD